MEFVGEDLAALDAALAFLDEWDLDAMEDGLGALQVATHELSPSSSDESQAPVDRHHEALQRMLEPKPFAAGGANMTIPMTTETTVGGNKSATASTGAAAVAGVKSESLSLAALDDALTSTETCPVEVDDKPRFKKRRDNVAAAATPATSAALTVPQDPRALALQSVNLRVKRRRQKEELLELRQKVQQLETRLTQIKANSPTDVSSPCVEGGAADATGALTNASGGGVQGATPEKPRAIQHRSPLGLVWERLAARQLKERERVEEENQRLKEMLDEHVKLARSLDRILRKRATSQRLSPDGMVISGREDLKEPRSHEDISRVNNLVIDLEGLYGDIDRISSRFGLTEQLQTPFRDTKLRTEPGDGVFLESMDSRVLPFDMRSTGATVWQFLAEESGGQARIYYQNCTNMTEDIRTCTYGIEVKHKETKAAFWGTSAMRKYVENGRIVISWSGQFEPVKTAEDTDCSFVFYHKGWVDITPSILDPAAAVVMQSYYRIAPELATQSDNENDKNTQNGDPNEKISALMDFVIATTDARLDASHQFIENLLMQRACSHETATS